MLGIAIGTIVKSGSNDYGCWALVAEAEVTKKDGGTFTPKVMCNFKDGVPADGTPVIVQGTVMTKVREHDGNHYADASLSFCRLTVLDAADHADPIARAEQATGGKAEYRDAPAAGTEDIPF